MSVNSLVVPEKDNYLCGMGYMSFSLYEFFFIGKYIYLVLFSWLVWLVLFVDYLIILLQSAIKKKGEMISVPFVLQSNKHTVPAGVFSPEIISNTDSEYAHLFGNGFEKTEVENENNLLLFNDDHLANPWEWISSWHPTYSNCSRWHAGCFNTNAGSFKQINLNNPG